MKRTTNFSTAIVVLVLSAYILFGTSATYAHCDTMNGPVVTAAQKALDSSDPTLVLIWVQKKDEAEIREAFTRTRSVRTLTPEARKLADMYFFETLVRVHRAGEGVAYTGLKPAESEIEPGIAAADKAIEEKSSKDIITHLTGAMAKAVTVRLTEVVAKKDFRSGDIESGREYVKAYVEFIH